MQIDALVVRRAEDDARRRLVHSLDEAQRAQRVDDRFETRGRHDQIEVVVLTRDATTSASMAHPPSTIASGTHSSNGRMYKGSQGG